MKFKSSLVVLAFVLSTFEFIYAQHSADQVSQALAGMKSTSWEDRSKAFGDASELLSSAQLTSAETDRLKVGIIQLLDHENNGGLKEPESVKAEDYGEGYGEDKSEYYAGLITFVAEMNDGRAIPALLGAANTGGIATRGIARFGKSAIGPAVNQVASSNAHLAEGGLWAIREILEMRTAEDVDSHRQIKDALRLALKSADHDVRETAVFVVEYLDDRMEFVPILEDIAQHDPYRADYSFGKKTPGRGDFTVRRDAETLLGKIANHEQPSLDGGVNQ